MHPGFFFVTTLNTFYKTEEILKIAATINEYKRFQRQIIFHLFEISEKYLILSFETAVIMHHLFSHVPNTGLDQQLFM